MHLGNSSEGPLTPAQVFEMLQGAPRRYIS
jgi:hypothetical protein